MEVNIYIYGTIRGFIRLFIFEKVNIGILQFNWKIRKYALDAPYNYFSNYLSVYLINFNTKLILA